MPSYPLDPRMEMSEAEIQGHWEIDHPPPRCHGCEDGGSQHSDQCEFGPTPWDPADHQGPIPDAVAQSIADCFCEGGGGLGDMLAATSIERSFRARGYRVVYARGRTVDEPVEVHSDPYVEMYRKIYGDDVLSAGFSLLKRLRGKLWRTQDDVELTPAEMTTSHAGNLVRWLERRAKVVLIAAQLEAGCSEIDHDGGQHAHDAIEAEANELLEVDAVEYLRRLPLYRAVVARAAEQQERPVSEWKSVFA